MLSFIAAAGGGVPIGAETIFKIGSLEITNSMITGIIIAIIVMTLFGAMALLVKKSPTSNFALFLESIADFILSSIKNNFNGDEKMARKFLPLFAAFFTFILINNLSGLLPGMGGTLYVETNGVREALLRPFTTDLNGTLALAFLAIGTVQFYAIKQRGFFGHLKHYFSLMPWWNPMTYFIGIIEIMSEFVRLATLALRLFGVIYAGEVVLHVMFQISGNFAPIATIPFVFVEIFFSLIQAYLFIMLSSVYLSMGTQSEHSDKKDKDILNNKDLTASAVKV